MKTLRNSYKRTRIAPTPSGYLHLGNVFSFAVTAALAQRQGARIHLRIDDLDRARVTTRYIQDIFDTLNFLAIPWDEGSRNIEDFEAHYSQLHRMAAYRGALIKLADAGLVFACTCTRQRPSGLNSCTCIDQQLPLDTRNAAWRLKTTDADITITGYEGQIAAAKLPAEINEFIVRKKDGFPSYQLTSVVDDIFYGVDLVVRGDDLWPSTLAQLQLATALKLDEFGNIAFYHHPLLAAPSGSKLSKSAGAISVKYLRESGKTAADVYALIADMLGFKMPVSNWMELGETVLSNR